MFIPAQLRRLEFGKRQLTFEDFLSVCSRLNILVFFTDENIEGVSIPRRRRQIIVLSNKLSGVNLLLVAWHELAHLLCGHAGVKLFLPTSLDIAERQADFISLCAVIPKTWIETRTIDELLEEGFSWETLWQRKYIYETYGV